MNFLADESCAGPVLRALREAGRDVVAIGEVARGATDEQVLERALGHVPHLRCSASYIPRTQRLRAGQTMSRLRRWKKGKCSLLIPALTRWAKVCRASGAGRNANSPFSSRRSRAGLNRDTPTAFVGSRRAGTAFRLLPGIFDAVPLHGAPPALKQGFSRTPGSSREYRAW